MDVVDYEFLVDVKVLMIFLSLCLRGCCEDYVVYFDYLFLDGGRIVL